MQRLRELAATPRVRRARAITHELAPVWWAARAYFAVGLLAILLGVDWSRLHPALPRFGGEAGTVLVLATALAGSFALGLLHRHARGGTRRAVIGLNAFLVAAAIPVLARAADDPPSYVYSEVLGVESRPGLVYDDVAVENVFPYDRKGRLLHDVRLFDQLGRPFETLKETVDPDRRPVRERNGARVFNAYPIRYFEPGTKRVARPNAGPEIDPRPLRRRPAGR